MILQQMGLSRRGEAIYRDFGLFWAVFNPDQRSIAN
jgi:hypothetical protein